ncbi:hypothetical protein V8C86DRAFT_2498748 [Haematococcus lacustris]
MHPALYVICLAVPLCAAPCVAVSSSIACCRCLQTHSFAACASPHLPAQLRMFCDMCMVDALRTFGQTPAA